MVKEEKRREEYLINFHLRASLSSNFLFFFLLLLYFLLTFYCYLVVVVVVVIESIATLLIAIFNAETIYRARPSGASCFV